MRAPHVFIDSPLVPYAAVLTDLPGKRRASSVAAVEDRCDKYHTSYCNVYGKAIPPWGPGRANGPETAPEALQDIKDSPAEPRPDIDLTDGTFYSGDSRSVYRWMRRNEPVFRDRAGLAAAATHQ